MAEGLLKLFELSLPVESKAYVQEHLENLKKGNFLKVLTDPGIRNILGHQDEKDPRKFSTPQLWTEYFSQTLNSSTHRLDKIRENNLDDHIKNRAHVIFFAALASLGAFLQSTVTGPPLEFSAHELIFPKSVLAEENGVSLLQSYLIQSLATDGAAIYRLAPNIELFWLAKVILTCPFVTENVEVAAWGRLRMNFLHQRLLTEISPSLQTQIYDDLAVVEGLVKSAGSEGGPNDLFTGFLLERSTIHQYHGFENEAKKDIEAATSERQFAYALTGLLGKKTKFQQKDISQLVVLAKSVTSSDPDQQVPHTGINTSTNGSTTAMPENMQLNDDLLLDSVSFTQNPLSGAEIQDVSSLPAMLASLDPSSQPLLLQLDSIILLSIASLVTNTSPSDGLTREETLPYVNRVLAGGSSNWQIYTEALHRRSIIEGYKSRTVERGLLQLQALVDQVVADTTGEKTVSTADSSVTTFLPKPKSDESAPASERLLYIYQLCSPYRWDLEAELAARWIELGGLKSALDIYSRLEMWPEVALCYAGTDRVEKAVRIVRLQLFHSIEGPEHDSVADQDAEEWTGAARNPPPADAARLYCILGDIEHDPEMYDKAWDVSNGRYARAQRSLGRHWWAQRDFAKASLAYSKALKAKQIDHGTWFAYGCCLLELSEFPRAAEAFSRAVQLDDTDAESWSNLAAALLHLSPEDAAKPLLSSLEPDAEEKEDPEQHFGAVDDQKHIRDALAALKRAAKHSPRNYQILSNLLTTAATLKPPVWSDMLFAQSRLIELRGKTDGEACIDVAVLAGLLNHAVAESGPNGYESSKPGFPRQLVRVMDDQVVPIITGSSQLWELVANMQLWRSKPSSALSAHEKAWRALTNKPGWETGDEKDWNAVVAATQKLVDAYRRLGLLETTEGLAAGSGQLVAKDWSFKARSAVRGVMGKGKSSWEDTAGWQKLVSLLEDLRN